MNRKQFIEGQGATCNNWTWSWSFVNQDDKIVIFGAWDLHTKENDAIIFSENWQIDSKGNKKNGYGQSLEHIRLVEKEGYQLKTFPMIYSDKHKDENDIGPATIGKFIPELTTKKLSKVGKDWIASDDGSVRLIPEEIDTPSQYPEGALKTITVNAYERNPEARNKCLKHHGYLCAVCSFDFKKVYGDLGQQFIHVHHRVPLATIKKEYKIDPVKDLVPVCPNCHAMIHRGRGVTVEELRVILGDGK